MIMTCKVIWPMANIKEHLTNVWASIDDNSRYCVSWYMGYWFHGPIVSSYGIKYILVIVDYVLKWVEAVIFSNNKWINVTTFLRSNIFLGLVHQKKPSMMGVITLVTIYSDPFLRNMVWIIRWYTFPSSVKKAHSGPQSRE